MVKYHIEFRDYFKGFVKGNNIFIIILSNLINQINILTDIKFVLLSII